MREVIQKLSGLSGLSGKKVIMKNSIIEKFNLKKQASTSNGEFSGACPWCGGDDRFRFWPNESKAGRYWCRQCHRSGDTINLLCEVEGLSYVAACRQLDISPGRPVYGRLPEKREKPQWKPKEPVYPGEQWRERAGSLVDYAQKQLWETAAGLVAVDYLKGRGLKEETIKQFRLGWISQTRFIDRVAWGLSPGKKLWIPSGILIPYCRRDQVIRLRIRRHDPDGPRYVIVSGSAAMPMSLAFNKSYLVVVESELDGLLLHQEVSVAGVVALGSVSYRPDYETDYFLRKAASILGALDSDSAGAKESLTWWKMEYNNFKRWPASCGKDPGEMFQQGVELDAWVQAGLNLGC